MTLGIRTCTVGKDGSPCKHQYVLWVANLADCINFIPVSNPHERQKLAWLAIGKTLPVACYKPLRSSDAGQTSQIDGSNGFVTEASTSMETAQQGPNCSTAEPIQSNDDDEDDSIANAEQLLRNSCEQIIQKLQSSRDPNLAKGVIRFAERVTSLTAARSMHFNLASALFSFGSSEVKKPEMEKRSESSPTENKSVVVEAVRLYQKGDQYNYKNQPPRGSAPMTWLKQYKQTLKVVRSLGPIL